MPSRRDDLVAVGAGFDAGLHQTAQFDFSAHVPAEGFDGVVVKSGFVEVRFGLHGFAPNVLHSFTVSQFHRIRGIKRCYLFAFSDLKRLSRFHSTGGWGGLFIRPKPGRYDPWHRRIALFILLHVIPLCAT